MLSTMPPTKQSTVGSVGVIDFKTKTYRDVRPEDCISKCTSIDYIPIERCRVDIIDEIKDFMQKLFPVPRFHDNSLMKST